MLSEIQARKLTNTSKHWFRYWMPYVFQPIQSTDHKYGYLPLNRNYKPLGQTDGTWADYDASFSTHGVVFGSDPLKFKGVWLEDGVKGLYLYADDPHSRLDYFKRFEILMTKTVNIVK